MTKTPDPEMPTPRLRILHTESSCGWGGQEIRILEEMRGMVARGHKVSLICPAEAKIRTRAAEAGLVVQALPISRKRPAGLIALRAWLKQDPVDIVNTHSSTDSWLVALCRATMRAAPSVVRTRHISAPVSATATSRWLYAKAADHVVTTGERLRDSLIHDLGLSPLRVTSVPTGIDVTRFSPGDKHEARIRLGLDADANWIGIIATLRSWKGHRYLLEALAKLARPDVRLAIVGDGPMKDAIAAWVVELGLSQLVILAGEQRNPETWMRALDVFCLPSYANEGVPQALMQAMLCGLPVISTPVGAITEAVTDQQTGLIVPAQDATALAGAIALVLADLDLATRLGLSAREDALQRFGFERMVDRMEQIFVAVVRNASK